MSLLQKTIYLLVLPIRCLVCTMAVPFIFIATATVNTFDFIQLLIRGCSPKNDSTKEDPDSEDDIYERFASTEDALKNILPDASKTDIEKYAQQLEDVENYDPILVISPNYNWIHQHSHQNYQKIMNEFATNGLQQNRRDKGSLCVFHFADVTELYAVRRNIRAIYPHAFFDPRAQPQQHPIGTAWVLYKIGMRKSDYDADECFFLLP